MRCNDGECVGVQLGQLGSEAVGAYQVAEIALQTLNVNLEQYEFAAAA
jgi:hypothetical protein